MPYKMKKKKLKVPRYEVKNNLRALEIPLSHGEQLLVLHRVSVCSVFER